MGNCCAFRRRPARRNIILLLVGLDNAGKTETLNNLAGESGDAVVPTIGFKAINLVHKSTPVTIYDLGGGPHFRQIWSHYYSEVHGLIFVVDSSDRARLDECKAVLEEVLSHEHVAGKPALILANKQDRAGAMDDLDVVEALGLEKLVNRLKSPTSLETYSARPEGDKKKNKIDLGLRRGYRWILYYIRKHYEDLDLRVQADMRAESMRRAPASSTGPATHNYATAPVPTTAFLAKSARALRTSLSPAVSIDFGGRPHSSPAYFIPEARQGFGSG